MSAAFHTILVAQDGHQGGLDAAALAGLLAAPDAELVTVRAQSAAAGLLELVHAHSADLLVLGEHHRHPGLHWHDHTRDALRRLPCPIAVAPRGYATTRATAIRSVGVGYVDDDAGRAVLDTARGVAWELGAEVYATTIVAPSNWPSAESRAGWRAETAARRMAEIPGVHGHAVEGEPHRVLAELSGDVDLLVIGSHHRGALRRLLPGDIAEDLSHRSRCPLLVLPHLRLS